MIDRAAAPPGPKGDPIFGNLLDLRRRPLPFLEECVARYGDIVSLKAGSLKAVLLNDPALIEQVLVTESRNFVKARLGTSEVFGNGLLVSEGDFWLRQRRMMQPAFHRSRIASYSLVTTRFTGRAIAGWKDGETRDIHEDMVALSLEIVARTLFGAEISRSDMSDLGRVSRIALDRSTVRLSLLPFLARFPLPRTIRFRREVARLDEIIYRIIETRRREGSSEDDLLAMLLEATDEEAQMTNRQLRDEVMTLLMAGHETTATALTWIWLLLSQHPEEERKLAAELQSVLGGREPTIDDMPALEQTGRIIRESLRIYPTGWMVGRRAIGDVAIGGYRIPVGTFVLMSQWTMHRDRRWFERPGEFDPDRWKDRLESRIPRYAYFPFGAGPRRCIGDQFALMEMTMMLATIAQRVRLTLVPGHNLEALPRLTLRPKYGMRMMIERR